MSIFGFSTKEGKGIEKNAPEKNIFYTYFESFIRNFWNLVKINILYIISSIPMILILAAFFAGIIYPNIQPKLADYIANSGIEEVTQAEATYTGVFMMLFVTEILLLVGSGPASASIAYAAKCMTNEEHVWLWSDFRKKFAENFKQSMIIVFVDIAAIVLVIYAMFFYTSAYSDTGNKIYFVLYVAVMIFTLLYCFMHGYIYQFIVTFENKLTAAYKNAFIMAMAKLPQNLLLTALSVLFTYFVFTVTNPVISLLLLLTVWYMIMRYPMEFYAARTIRKLIVSKQSEEGHEN